MVKPVVRDTAQTRGVWQLPPDVHHCPPPCCTAEGPVPCARIRHLRCRLGPDLCASCSSQQSQLAPPVVQALTPPVCLDSPSPARHSPLAQKEALGEWRPFRHC